MTEVPSAIQNSEIELTIKGDVERLSIGPNDFVVVSLDSSPPPSEVKRIGDKVAAMLGVDASRVIVACEGMKFQVIGKDAVESNGQ